MPNETEVKGLNQEQRAWLARYLGAKVPWKVTVQREGEDVDADESAAEQARVRVVDEHPDDGQGAQGLDVRTQS